MNLQPRLTEISCVTSNRVGVLIGLYVINTYSAREITSLWTLCVLCGAYL